MAAEAGVIASVANTDSIIMICVKGNYEIYYSNLRKVFVKRGEKVKVGQILGELPVIEGFLDDEALMMLIKKNGRDIVDKSIFRR